MYIYVEMNEYEVVDQLRLIIMWLLYTIQPFDQPSGPTIESTVESLTILIPSVQPCERPLSGINRLYHVNDELYD